jgi:hypothetical protein
MDLLIEEFAEDVFGVEQDIRYGRVPFESLAIDARNLKALGV